MKAVDVHNSTLTVLLLTVICNTYAAQALAFDQTPHQVHAPHFQNLRTIAQGLPPRQKLFVAVRNTEQLRHVQTRLRNTTSTLGRRHRASVSGCTLHSASAASSGTDRCCCRRVLLSDRTWRMHLCSRVLTGNVMTVCYSPAGDTTTLNETWSRFGASLPRRASMRCRPLLRRREW